MWLDHHWLTCIDLFYIYIHKSDTDNISIGQRWCEGSDVHRTWSNSCLPVVLGWMANSSSASMVVTRTLTCWKKENKSSKADPEQQRGSQKVRTDMWLKHAELQSTALVWGCVCVCLVRRCICRVNTLWAVCLSLLSQSRRADSRE